MSFPGNFCHEIALTIMALQADPIAAQATFEMGPMQLQDWWAGKIQTAVDRSPFRPAGRRFARQRKAPGITDRAALQLLRTVPAAVRRAYREARAKGRTPRASLNIALRRLSAAAFHD